MYKPSTMVQLCSPDNWESQGRKISGAQEFETRLSKKARSLRPFKKFFLLLYVWVFFLNICLYTMWVSGANKARKGRDHLELELRQFWAALYMGAESNQVLWRAAGALNIGDIISPALLSKGPLLFLLLLLFLTASLMAVFAFFVTVTIMLWMTTVLSVRSSI